jgi:DNA-binding GntR family transcriptional regulator
MRDTAVQAAYADFQDDRENQALTNSRDPEAFTNLRNMVLHRVRSDIVAGHSAPGTMYSVPTLADELGISTTPVREALLELSNSGLITPVRNRGFRVEPTSIEDLKNGFALRELLERYAMVRLAEKRLSNTDELRRIADTIAAAVKREDARGYIDADRAFHLALVSRVEIPQLTKMIMDLRDGMRLYGMETIAGRHRMVASVNEHYQLIEMAQAGDAEGIAGLITRHILDWEPVFTAAMEKRDSNALQSRRR